VVKSSGLTSAPPIQSEVKPPWECPATPMRPASICRPQYVLPAMEKLDRILYVRSLCHEAGMTFGAADNEFIYLSDGEACCSGVDRFPGFDQVFRYQISAAIKRSWPNQAIVLEQISHEWRPDQSIDWCLNSRTRLAHRGGTGTLGEHVRRRWNDSAATGTPASYFGVVDTGKLSNAGDRIYAWSHEAKSRLVSVVGEAGTVGKLPVITDESQLGGPRVRP
jgi:hypothetical protein